ncbi:hypothetical protein [Desulfococcus multivorans]|uniref:Uncharacterized protein n=1 Tax=Desulfococcus multivorans DSM 2059 TaxID=1121405 RepID=S7TA99_DESML|nr:hypothetical protein [Desulfococcus multivorans]AOY57258.1 uncharacterized protein Dmul_04830 [Desulfococcus multivorans]AQU99714.1 hypothetical protein B2D07_02260 [Desulfococcus multivorans]EPR34042.1 hypothetical protein dsmv_3481 [Desulfococcus multivorans DSM 2059]SKA27034.1 hypothetical protein SAMN02745446_03669 [Desulfococcus multivorans DSM 2059]
MVITATQEKFLQLFSEYMVRHERAYRPLADFMNRLKFEQVRECLSSYLDVFKRYDLRDKYSLRIFYELSLLAVKEDVYFALRYEVLTAVKGNLWFERHAALENKQRNQLLSKVKQKKRALSWTQKEFIRIFDDAMKRHIYKPVSDYIFKLMKGTQLQECLLVYIEVSARYPDTDHNSLAVFFGLSSLAIHKSDAFFAARFDKWISTAGTPWETRYSQLTDREQKILKSDIAGKTKGMKVSSGAKPADIGEKRKTVSQTAVQKKFVKLFKQYMTDPKHDQRIISEFIFGIRKNEFQKLRECMIAYLEASAEYADNDTNSLRIFYGISGRVIGLGDAYYTFKYVYLTNAVGTVWAKRYAALSKDQKADLGREIDKKKGEARFIDEFKFAYYQKNQKDPNLKALRAFEPVVNKEQKKLLRDVSGRCDRAFNLHKIQDLLKAFDDLADLFKAQNDPATFLVMLKWCRDASDMTPWVRDEIYWYGIQALFQLAVNTRTLTYLKGFSEEERQFLIHIGAKPNPYFHDFEERLEYMVRMQQGRSIITEISKAHLALLLIADQYRIHLVPMAEAQRVRRLVETLRTDSPRSIDELQIPINSPMAPNTKLRIGQTVGNIFIIWWDGDKGVVYVEVNGIGRILFSMGSYIRLGQIYQNDAIYGEIWRNTRHLMMLIPAFFEVLGYLPDLASGGFGGLVKSVVVNYVAGEVSQRVFGDSTAGQIVTTLATGAAVGHLTKGRGIEDVVDDEARLLSHSGESAAGKSTAAVRQAEADVVRAAEDLGAQRGATLLSSADDVAQQAARTESKVGTKLTGSADQPPPPSQKLLPGKVSGSAELTALATGLDPAQVQSIADVLNVRFTEMRGFSTAWNHIATQNAQRIRAVQELFGTNLTKREIAAAARDTFDDIRTQFWFYVGISDDLAAREIRDQLSHAGFFIPRDGTAPFVRLQPQQVNLVHPDGSPAAGSSVKPPPGGTYEFRLDVDHIAELGQQPAKAFSSGNLRLTPSQENRIFLNQTYMRDPSLPDARLTVGRGTSRAGKMLGDPEYKGRSPHKGLLPPAGGDAMSRAAAADARAAIDEALRRLEQSPADDVF